MGASDRKAAFSLVEMVLVLAIVAVLASMAVPRFSNSAVRYRADAAARRVAADLTLARQHARRASTTQQVLFDTASGRYQLPGFSDPDHPESVYGVWLGQEPYSATIVSVDFGGEPLVTFNGFGVPESGGSVVVGVGSELRTITVDVDTGKASVQ